MSAKQAKIEDTNDNGLKLLPREVIKSEQDVIRGSLVKLDRAIHDNAIQCMLHAREHGDTSLMRRLLVETLDKRSSGYRTQGLINWMRTYSPMELKGDIINLGGTDGKGNKRPWEIEEAALHPFWTDRRNDERVARPVFQDTLLSPLQRSIKAMIAAVENTVNGQPVDPKKPYFEGSHADKIVDFAKKVEELTNQLPEDQSLVVRKAKIERARLDAVIREAEAREANEDDLKKVG